MQGHIRKRGKSSWAVVLSLGRDAQTGKKKQKWYGQLRSRREAQQKLAQLLVDIQQGTWTPPTRMTTGEFLLKWLDDYARGAVGPVSFANYEGMVRRQIIPALGHLPLARIGPAALQGYYAAKLATGVTSTTVHAHHRVLETALGHAVRWGHISRNPAALTNPPRPRGRDVTVWDAEQVRLFLGEAKRTSRYYALYLTALLTGMRLGELLGLRWQDLDFTTKTATVRQTFYRLGAGDAGRLFKEPKTAGSRRAVHLPAAVLQALCLMREEQEENRRLLGDVYARALDLVFCQPNGQPLHGHNITQRDFRRVCTRAGVPRIRFHDLRHAHASYLALAGVPLKVAQERLGHSTPIFTARVYQHVLAGQQEAAARAVEGLLLGRDRRDGEADEMSGVGKAGQTGEADQSLPRGGFARD